MASNQEIIDIIKTQFGDRIIAADEQSGQLCFSVRRDDHIALLRFFKETKDLAFDFLMDLFGVDYAEMGGVERYAVIYNLYSLPQNHRVRVRVWVPENDPRLDSAVLLWSAANWAEREAYDMYGITFAGHPNMTRILCPDDFSGFPLRKDFPLEGIGYRENFEKIENPKTK
jgi:NADH-quinone oxidoreductase subunit C